jgi:Flp pilus assembly protein TadG
MTFESRPAKSGSLFSAVNRFRQFGRTESGAETVEFALVFPLVLIVVFGLIYGILGMAAQLSLTHAASVGVRFATIPPNPAVDVYPSSAAVQAKVLEATPFFAPTDCVSTVPEAGAPNQAFTLTVVCDFPNPAGGALNGLRNIFIADGASPFDTELTLTANARGRRE